MPAHVSAAFFGEDDRYDDYTLARLHVEQDTSLSPAERAARLSELFAQLPEATQASMRSIRSLQEVERIDAGCRQQGCTPEQWHQQRAAVVGEEAAVRLQALDAQRAAWSARLNAYLAQRAAILADPSLSEPARQAQIQGLQQAGFTAEERLRLPAFETAEASGRAVPGN